MKLTKKQIQTAKDNGLHLRTVHYRINKGWSIKRAITEVTPNNLKKIKGVC